MGLLILRSSASQGGGGAAGVTFDSGYDGSGTFADGEDFTITSSGLFPSKANAKPLRWIPLESDFSPHATLSRVTTALDTDVSSTIQASVMPTNSAGAARTRACDSSTASPAPIVFQDGISFATTEFYIWMKRRYAHAEPQNLKVIRAWPPAVSETPDFYFAHGVQSVAYCESIDVGSFTDGSRFHGLAWSQNAWTTWEHHFRQSTLNTIDGIFNVCRDGALVFPNTQRWKSRATGMSQDMTQVFFDEYSNESGLDSFIYHSGIYVDDTPVRVFLSDETSFSTAETGTRLREIQIPHTTWTTSSITFRVRRGSFPSMSGKCLYVASGHHSATRILTVD